MFTYHCNSFNSGIVKACIPGGEENTLKTYLKWKYPLTRSNVN